MNIKLHGVLLIFLVPFFLTAQIDRSNYQLLWEISGNELTQPSYLFGTIHLKDKRVFEFSDSMYYMLEKCDAFAIEVHPDSINNYLLDLYSNKDTVNTLKQNLSPSAYDDINKLLFEKVGKTIEDLKNKNPFLIQMMLGDEPNEKPTDKDLFMDLFLYRMARNQGKETFGLEKIQDHEDLTASFFRTFENPPEIDYFNNFWVNEDPFESLINLYLTGDLELIQQLYNYEEKSEEDEEYHHELINKRNQIISNNIATLIHQKSTFNAIGAAHLPGKEGVIELLRAKGYKLRPVTAKFTGKSQQYKYKKSTPIWYTYRSDFHRYSVSFPGKPYKLENKEKSRLVRNIQLYNDIVEDQFYTAICINLFSGIGIENDSFLLKEIEARFVKKENYELLSVEPISEKSNKGLEFIVQKDTDRFLIGKTFHANDNLYFVTVERNDDNFEHPDIYRFFQSFQIDEQINKSWKTFYNEQGAFSIRMPHEPDYQNIIDRIDYEDGESQNYSLHVYMARELDKGMTYFVRYNDLPDGRIAEDDTLYLGLVREMFEERAGKELESKVIFKEGYEGREFFYGQDTSVFARVQTFFRGNRMYLLIGQSVGVGGSSEAIDAFFNSFKFEPFLPSELTKYTYEEEGFEVSFPKPPLVTIDTFFSYNFPYEYNKLYTTTDPNSGAVYGLSKSDFSTYYRAESADSLINLIIEAALEETDTLLESKELTINDLPAKRIKIGSSIINSMYNSIILIKGNTAYEVYIYAPENLADEINSFLNSFSVDGSPDTFNLAESKIETIITDLQSTDSLRFTKANTALTYYSLEQEELPVIYDAFSKKYPNDTLSYSSVVETFCEHLTLVNDKNTIPFLAKSFQTFDGESKNQIAILTAILNIEKADSINVFFELAKDYLETGDDDYLYYYYLFERFHDSLELAQAYFPQLMELNKNAAFSGQILSITSSIVSQDSIDVSFIETYKSGFREQARAIVDEYELMSKDTIDYFDDYWLLTNLIDILTELKFDDESRELFNSLLDLNSQGYRAQVVLALIKNDLKVNKKHWNYIYTDLYEWHNLLLALEKIDRLDKVPSNQLNKKNIAKAALYSYIYDDYDAPTKMKIIDVQPFEYEGEELSICVMEFYYYEDDGPYISIVSQPKQKGKINISPKIIDLSYETYEEGNYQPIVDSLLEYYKK